MLGDRLFKAAGKAFKDLPEEDDEALKAPRYEFEAKGILTDPGEVQRVVEKLKEHMKVTQAKLREQWTHVVARDLRGYYVTSEERSKNGSGVRYKKRYKTTGELIALPDPEMKFFVRNEIRPGKVGSRKNIEYIRREMLGFYIDSFRKRCGDISFIDPTSDIGMTATFSLVDAPRTRGKKDTCYQLELEIDGYRGKEEPSMPRTLRAYGKAAEMVFENIEMTTETKLEYVARGKLEHLVPHYTAIPPKKSKLLPKFWS